VTTDAYPLIKEFGRGATTCPTGGQHGTGCAVCSTAVFAIRYGHPIPRLADRTPDMITLGSQMGALHRAAEPGSRHGLSLRPGQRCSGGYWCAYCAYLLLKSWSLPVAYGPLTSTKILDQLRAKHPIIVPGDYWRVPVIEPGSISDARPALGRVQKSFSTRPFGHMITAWEINDNDKVVVSDPDFGSYDGAPVPPHSLWSIATLINFWSAMHWNVTYGVTAPPAIGDDGHPTPPKPISGVTYRFGGRPTSRGSYLIGKGVRVRTSPRVLDNNVVLVTTKPTSFAAAQATYAGTNVGGSTLWLGNHDGTRWVFKDLTTLAGHTTGHEEIQ
jgi:hypothetical protein